MALKYKVPFTLVRSIGSESFAPGLMSLTKTVPAAVPSLFHNSPPCVPSLARKYKVPFTFVRSVGLERFSGLMSFTSFTPNKPE